MEIDNTIDILLDTLALAGVDPPRPSDPAVLEEIAAAIKPLYLPADLRRFWERVDPDTLRVAVYPAFCAPRFALESWRSARREFPEQPVILFLVAQPRGQPRKDACAGDRRYRDDRHRLSGGDYGTRPGRRRELRVRRGHRAWCPSPCVRREG